MSFTKKGFGVIEIVIGSAIITIGIVALIGAYSIYIQYAFSHDKDAQAVYLLEEGLEVMSFKRDSGWNTNIKNLTPGTQYYLSWNGSTWNITATPVSYIDNVFLRYVTAEDVSRDINDDISESGTIDQSTRKITVTLEYFQGKGTTTKSASEYLTNIYAN